MNDILAGQAGTAAPSLVIQKLYVKDASFEVPHAPEIFQDQNPQQVQLNLSQKVSNFAQDLYEVVLTVTVTCKAGERTAYLAEVQQAGVFTLTGFQAEQLQGVLATYCPHVLYPYARQVIGDLVINGGFPPFLMQPINFEQLYAEQMRRQQGTVPAGNA
jgi:preprotein translocase subunit SecB